MAPNKKEPMIMLPRKYFYTCMFLISDLERRYYNTSNPYVESLTLDGYELEAIEYLKKQNELKIASIESRIAFTDYKQAPTSEERESNRQKYLDLAGIHKDWRSSTETKDIKDI